MAEADVDVDLLSIGKLADEELSQLLDHEALYYKDELNENENSQWLFVEEKKLNFYRHLLCAEDGLARSGYQVLDYAFGAIQNILLVEQANIELLNQKGTELGDLYPIHQELRYDSLESIKYLARCLQRVLGGEDPKKAFNLTPRRGEGTPTIQKQLEEVDQYIKERNFAAGVAIAYNRFGNLDESCLYIAERNQMEDKEHTVKHWYSKHKDRLSKRFIDLILRHHPDLTGLDYGPLNASRREPNNDLLI